MGCFGYRGAGVEWCLQLSSAFDNAMLAALHGEYPGVLWCDGKHELYCMGGEL